eukprot:scaffold248621_cov41-Prasinocladus_malaysianus.AAC.1
MKCHKQTLHSFLIPALIGRGLKLFIVEPPTVQHLDLLHAYHADLKEVNDIFNYNKEKPVLSKNAAPMSGAVAWVGGLVRRIEEPMAKLRAGNKVIMETEEAKEINKLYNTMIAAMQDYKASKVNA